MRWCISKVKKATASSVQLLIKDEQVKTLIEAHESISDSTNIKTETKITDELMKKKLRIGYFSQAHHLLKSHASRVQFFQTKLTN